MNSCCCVSVLENVVYKMFRRITLSDNERAFVEKIVEVRDYGLELE